MSDTPRMALPLIEAAQAQKHVTHNEALVVLDALAHLFLLDRDLADPPASPAEGDAWLVASPASGAWTGQEGRIAFRIDGDWRFYSPFKGLRAYIGDEQSVIIHDGAGWSDFAALISPQNVPQLGVGTTADGANPFAAKLNNALFTALEAANGGDGDIRLKVNKEDGANTASFLFQSAYSGRAEIGLVGDEDFHFKVSSDGAAWIDALKIDSATGALASQGNALWHGGNDGAGSGLDADLLDGIEAATLANPAAASQGEAEAGTETALRSFSPLRIAQAISALGGGGLAQAGIERDIRLLFLKQAADDGDRINMSDGIADPLDDASDIDTGASTNIDSGTAGQIKPTGGETTEDGGHSVAASANQSSYTYFDRSWTIDNSKTVTKIWVYSTAAISLTVKIGKRNSAGNYDIVVSQGGFSHGGTGWEAKTLTTPYAVPASGTYQAGIFVGAATSFQYASAARSYKAGDITGAGQSGFGEDTASVPLLRVSYQGTPNNMDCRSKAFTANTAPDTARLHLQVGGADAGALTLNTDLIGYCSRDGGASWTAANLALAVSLADGTLAFEDAEIDLSGQPSGTAMKWRVATANSIDISLRGVVEQWM
ncbi:MAG: DUF2793 domain-containing protein [Rhodobiaceae bacterium]|nr:DUF2793 domain-containing protein [Rhodobiaceae bacterium]